MKFIIEMPGLVCTASNGPKEKKIVTRFWVYTRYVAHFLIGTTDMQHKTLIS